MARACDLTQGGLLCPAKALLTDQDDSRDAFDLYSRYFDKFLFVDDGGGEITGTDCTSGSFVVVACYVLGY